MPSKKRKYNARFPAGRIKRIMQADEEVGKIAHAVPVIISRTLELFVESLLTKSSQITLSRNSKTLSPSHLKQCIMSESRFDFLKDLVKNVPDISNDECNSAAATEEHHNTEQNSVPASYNGNESNGSSASVATRIYQRSQSFQPSTSSSSNSCASQVPQYHNPTIQQKQFYLNNYTTVSKQNTKPNMMTIPLPPQQQSNEYRPTPAKIARFNSIPSCTITSEPQQSNKQSLVAVAAAAAAPLEFPIKITYNVDGKTESSTESPTVKIDYSNLSLPATSPSIKIDLSSFTSQLNTTSIQQQQQQQPSNQSAATLDEDYDA